MSRSSSFTPQLHPAQTQTSAACSEYSGTPSCGLHQSAHGAQTSFSLSPQMECEGPSQQKQQQRHQQPTVNQSKLSHRSFSSPFPENTERSEPHVYSERGHLVRTGEMTREERDVEFESIERTARIALEAVAMHDDDVEKNGADYLATLKVYRTACKERAMYREASLVNQVMRSLRIEEESRHVRGLTQMQMGERLLLEDDHRDDFRAFHHSWNEKIDAFEELLLAQEIALVERQNEELSTFQEEMRNFNPRVLRYSRDLMNSRSRQHNLAKMKEFSGALLEKEKGDEIEFKDLERFQGTRSAMYERREYALRRQHQQELHALRMKAESKRLYLERTRKRELDELLQRYLNARRELETQQNVIRSKTGALLLKHAMNNKTDVSGTAALAASACSGTFGTVVQRQHMGGGAITLSQRSTSGGRYKKDQSQPTH